MPDRTPSELWDATAERSREVASTVADASRVTARSRTERLRRAMPSVLQAAIGAAVAWEIATQVFGHVGAFFAPVSVIITLGLTYGQRLQRAVELAFAVALGIGIGDAIVIWLGTGPWQIVLVTGLAMTAAILLGGSRLVVTQAASSAILVATVQVPTTFTFTRFTDALIGGTVAVVINLLIAPVDPIRLVHREAKPVLDELAGVLDALAAALRARDHDAVVEAVVRAREVDGRMAALMNEVTAGAETARYAPLRRGDRHEVARYAAAFPQLELASRNTRVLGRACLRAVDVEAHVPPEAPEALADLGAAVRATRDELLHPGDTPPGGAREAVLRAAGRTQSVLERTNNLSVSVIVGQIRATCADLLRGMGMSAEESRVEIRRVAAEVEAAELAAGRARADAAPPA